MDSVVASEAIDPGSTPGIRTMLRRGYGWQAAFYPMSVSTLSVIFPTYNCRGLIERHLVEARKWLDLANEVIVVDSFSTDGTMELIREELRHPNLRIISREPGLYESWNSAIQASRGDWIYISTTGDWIERSHLQHLKETGTRLQADVVISRSRFITRDGRPRLIRSCPAWRLIRDFGLKSPMVFHPSMAQYFAFSTYPLAVLGSSAANLYRGEHLRARIFPIEHGHGGDTIWMLRHGHETRLCVTPLEGATFYIHRSKAATNPPDYNAILRKEIGGILKSGVAGDLLQMFINHELPLVLACRSLQSRINEQWNRDLPAVIRLGYWTWTSMLLRLQTFRLLVGQARIHRQIRARMTQA